MLPRRVGRPRRNEHVPRNEYEWYEVREEMRPPPRRRVEETFLKQNPPVFDGMGDPANAETWIRNMERIFNLLQCNDQERLNCVAFQLEGPADYWWEARRKIMTPEQLAQLTWEDFKEGIYDKYIPRSYRKEKEVEFYNLTQGKMSVTDYDRTFCHMSRYAPALVDTDAKMAAKFCGGLRHEIRMALASQGELPYAESLRRALDIEAAMPKEDTSVPTPLPSQQQHNSRNKRKWDEDRTLYDNKRKEPTSNQMQYDGRRDIPSQRGEYQPKAPLCVKCSKHHFGVCKAGTNECYKCGGSGHFFKECPNKKDGMRVRKDYKGSHSQLHALRAEVSRDLSPPTYQYRYQHQGYEEATGELEDKMERQ